MASDSPASSSVSALRLAETLIVWGAATFLVACFLGFGPAGADAPLQVLRMERPDGIPLAAGPQRVIARLAMMALGADQGMALAVWALTGAGAAMLWHLRRRSGSTVAEACMAAAFGGFSPVLLQVSGRAQLEFLAVPLVALALYHPRENPWRTTFLLMLLGAGDARLGLLTGVTAAVLSGQWTLAFAGIVAGGIGETGSSDRAHLNLDALLSPWWGSTTGLVAGVATLLGSFLLPPPWRRASLVGWIAAVGPLASVGGETLTVNHLAWATPGLLFSMLVPASSGWSAGLVVVTVLVGLGLRRNTLGSFGFVGLLLLESWRSLSPSPTPLEVPLAISDMAGREGTVLHLPLEIEGAETAPFGSHALYRYWAWKSGRTTLPTLDPLGPKNALYNEPLVILTADALGLDYLVPPTLPGDALRTLGIHEVVLHRGRFPPDALRLIEPIFQQYLGFPQSDAEADISVYRVPAGAVHPLEVSQVLRQYADPDAPEWRTLFVWLRDVAQPSGVKHE